MGTDPTDGEEPISYDELSTHTQMALEAFEYCTDKWDTMNGGYLGKDLNNLEFIYKVLKINPKHWSMVLLMLTNIIDIKSNIFNKKIKAKNKAKK